MRDAVIVDVVRTPVGRRNGALSGWHAVDLASTVLEALVARTGIDPALVEDVIMGCVSQVGEQGINVARNAVLAAGFPESVPGTTVDRQCGSSQQAVAFAAQGVLAGAYDVVIAAGVESMSRVPMGSNGVGPGSPFGPRVEARYAARGGLVPQGISAELIVERWGLTRQELDAFALRSHERAWTATTEGRFKSEILPIEGRRADGAAAPTVLEADEGIRPDTSLEALGSLKPAFVPTGTVTAGNASQISDGAAAALIMDAERARRLGLVPRARVVAFSLAADDPIMMLTAPIPATRRVLERAHLSLDDIDLVEINEAFASVVLAWGAELHPDWDRVNVNGGAIALGHPLGASGARLLATLVNELERRGGRYGLQTMCEGGGMANALVIERLG
ncbi:acetyl-CoA acetyltransferase [Acidimicrobium ferrooxidans DSM 10331]|uniref:Acetyl-CoA acetyltransferase n=1 Tax=Acidimicrobium ferrooxidans (strain DSM 10331 / JCM 15462 / NBRC 103882 / ICP) TaxID=525909 RepID=C7M1K7_ACIFD|nr:thiolase family protein [Acidimicrobium ferrooxidans]ACU53056.1 acetyl-CoA acetyltransferase [Acidimicrobium ferrooxidans DSM 10331]